MSNQYQPSGFAPVSYLNAAKYSGQARRYWIPASDTNAYYIGDVVVSTPGATNGVPQPQQPPSIGTPQITKATASSLAVRGVIIGIELDPQRSDLTFIPAAKAHDYFVHVADDAELVFEIQGNNTSPLAATCVNSYANFIVGAPSANGVSGTILDTASISSASGPLLQILGMAQKPQNDFNKNTLFLVRFTKHELGSGGGVPILFAAGGTPALVQGNVPTTATTMGVAQLDASGNLVGPIVGATNTLATLTSDTSKAAGYFAFATDVPAIVEYTGVPNGGVPLLGTTYNLWATYKTATQVNTGTATTATITSNVDIVQITAGAPASLAITVANGTTLGQEIQVELISTGSISAGGIYSVAGVNLGSGNATNTLPGVTNIPSSNFPVNAVFKWNGTSWVLRNAWTVPTTTGSYATHFGLSGAASGTGSFSNGGIASGTSAFTQGYSQTYAAGDYSFAFTAASGGAGGIGAFLLGGISGVGYAHCGGSFAAGGTVSPVASASSIALNGGQAYGAYSYAEGVGSTNSLGNYPAQTGFGVSGSPTQINATALTLTTLTLPGNVTPAGGGYFEAGAFFTLVLGTYTTGKSYLCKVTSATYTTSTAIVYSFVDTAPTSVPTTGTVSAASPGAYGRASGYGSNMLNMGGRAWTGSFVNLIGDAQEESYIFGGTSVGATAVVLTLDMLAVNTALVVGNSDRFIPQPNKSYHFDAILIGRQAGASTNTVRHKRLVDIVCNSSGASTVTFSDSAPYGTDINVAGVTSALAVAYNATYKSVDFTLTNTGATANYVWCLRLVGAVAMAA